MTGRISSFFDVSTESGPSYTCTRAPHDWEHFEQENSSIYIFWHYCSIKLSRVYLPCCSLSTSFVVMLMGRFFFPKQHIGDIYHDPNFEISSFCRRPTTSKMRKLTMTVRWPRRTLRMLFQLGLVRTIQPPNIQLLCSHDISAHMQQFVVSNQDLSRFKSHFKLSFVICLYIHAVRSLAVPVRAVTGRCRTCVC